MRMSYRYVCGWEKNCCEDGKRLKGRSVAFGSLRYLLGFDGHGNAYHVVSLGKEPIYLVLISQGNCALV
jgi:hypothetical protein